MSRILFKGRGIMGHCGICSLYLPLMLCPFCKLASCRVCHLEHIGHHKENARLTLEAIKAQKINTGSVFHG